MITALMFIVLLLAIAGLALAIYGETKKELFCYYSGMSLGVISVTVLICTMFVL